MRYPSVILQWLDQHNHPILLAMRLQCSSSDFLWLESDPWCRISQKFRSHCHYQLYHPDPQIELALSHKANDKTLWIFCKWHHPKSSHEIGLKMYTLYRLVYLFPGERGIHDFSKSFYPKPNWCWTKRQKNMNKRNC